MNDLKSLALGIMFFMIGQTFTFYQLNGQFIWKWVEKNPLLVSLLGIPISLIFISATKYTVIAFDHIMWPQRFIGFASGIFIYAWGTYYYFNQAIDVKTAISLGLALVLIGIQVFWK
jgi:hypothetical protein|tara:strand:+ start:309 stop:659 length:351 start_codon:yes stop_codon:yes gene_type:complete